MKRLGRGHNAGQRLEAALERRDPNGATSPSGYMNVPGRPMMAEWDAETAYRAYVSQWLVNRAVDILADRISSFPFRVGADPDKPGDYDKRAKLAQLLGPAPGVPNPMFSARKFWKWTIINYLVTGRFAWEIERGKPRADLGAQPGRQQSDSSGIVGLWPLVTAIFRPLPSDGGRSYFTSYEYTPYGQGRPIPKTLDQIVYGWNPHPNDFRQPFSRLEALALNVNITYEIDRYSFAFMQNDGMPASMIVHGRFPTNTQRDSWRAKILGNHKGAQNAGKVMFTEGTVGEDGKITGSVEVIPMGANNRDSQLSLIYDQQLQAISGGIGVPMSRLDASGRTFNNAGQEDINWHEDSILPLCRDLADIVNISLAPKFDDGNAGWFDLSQVRALKPRMSDNVPFAAIEGDMLRDERRQYAGLGPVDLKALEAEKEADAKMATPLLLPPPGDSLGRLPAAGINPSIGHPGAPKAGVESQASAKPPAADAAANANTGNGAGARSEAEILEEAYRALSPKDQASFDAESARIKASKTGPVARSPHPFKAALWTHPNGHPRCAVCGQEEGDGDCEGVEDPKAALGHSGRGIRAATSYAGKGCMIALYPDDATAAELAGQDGASEAAGDLHVTVAYLAETPKDLEALKAVVAGVAHQYGELSGVWGGIGQFNASKTSDGQPVSVALPDLPGLAPMRQALVEALNAAGFPVSDAHGYTPHLTLAYGPMTAGLKAEGKVSFGELVLAAGGKRYPFALTGGTKRHAGPAGHDHVSSGHHEKGSLSDVLVKARDAAAMRYTSLLGAQLAELDGRAVASTQARASGKRGQQLLRDGGVRADAIFEPEFWTTATRQAVQPVFYAVAAAAELALGTLPEPLPDLEAWATARATAFAEARVAAQVDRLALEVVTGLGAAIDSPLEALALCAPVLRDDATSSQIVADVWDDAVRSLKPSVAVEDLKALLVRVAAGEIDIDNARRELEI